MSDIIEALKWRYAAKEFNPNKKLTKNQLHTLTEAVRLTPSSFGLQPWKFLVIENQEIKKSLVVHSYGQKQVAQASHHFVLCHKIEVTAQDIAIYIRDIAKQRNVDESSLEGLKKYMHSFVLSMDRATQQAWMKNQVYIALGNLMTAAAIIEVDTCPMEGFSPEGYDEILGLKNQGLMSCVVCPVGFRAESDKYATTKKVRFSEHDMIKYI